MEMLWAHDGHLTVWTLDLNQIDNEDGSPVDIAKIYMRSRPPWASPSPEHIELRTPSTMTGQLSREGALFPVGDESSYKVCCLLLIYWMQLIGFSSAHVLWMMQLTFLGSNQSSFLNNSSEEPFPVITVELQWYEVWKIKRTEEKL